MEKLTMSNAFQKSIDNLKNTECSQKEKIGHFLQILECLQSPTLRSNTNYLTYLSAGMSTLLLFCEDTDSVTRMSAEENLNKIIRFCENGNIVRVQVELYHEIKKNGNERSLRICLNLFSYYCHLIKQRKARSYAQNLLPCIYAISRRTETLLLETLAEFLKTFCKYLQNCVTDNETSKLIEIFLEDLKSDCAVKRRCSAQNVITLIENSLKPEQFSQFALTTALDCLIKNQNLNTILGIMGFLRIILPIILKSEKCDYFKLIEIYELCLQYLNEKNHSIINASLEVINVILVNSDRNLKNILREYDTKEILLKKKSLKNLVFHISSGACLESQKNSRKSSVDEKKEHTTQHLKVDEKMMNLSDAELESLKSMDFDTEIELINKKTDENKPTTATSTLKPQKSIESFGSFINSILPNTNTDSVSKFFRSQLTGESPAKVQTFKFYDEDNLSIDSMNNSFVSMQSLPYDTQSESLITLKEEHLPISNIPLTPEIKIIDQTQSIIEQSIKDASEMDCRRDITIGTILDQSILEYTVRLICSRFLLAGDKDALIPDHIVRVSIKNLSLMIISNCVAINPHLLLINLENDSANDLENFDILLDDDDDEEEEDDDDDENVIVTDTENFNQVDRSTAHSDTIERDDSIDNLLEIKDDHFGENSTKFLDLFSTPLSRSVNESSSIKPIQAPIQSNMSRSEIIYEKYKKDLTKMLTPLTLKSTKDLLMSSKNDGQKIYDVILFAQHHDPILRGNTQNIISNFIVEIMKQTNNKYLTHEIITIKLLNLNNLLKIIIKSFSDEIHTVVKQALIAFESIFPFLLRSNAVLANETIVVDHISNTNHTIDSDDVQISTKCILQNLLMVFENKYWVVQCKYGEVIAGLDFDIIKSSLGDNVGAGIEKQCLNHLMTLLKDSDIRVRNHIGTLLSTLITKQSNLNSDVKFDLENTTIEDFLTERIFNELPIPLNYVIKSNNSTVNSNKYLGKMLYALSNSLLEISDKNQQFGIINAIKELVVKFNPIFYNTIWNEYKILEVCLSFLHHNIVTGLDLTCQSDLLIICTNLICGSTYSFSKPNQYVKIYLTHLLKLLNIFDHLFMDTKPLIIPKGQKADLFVGAKELQSLNKIGYFGNNHFYLKLFRILKSGYESYKITINKDSGSKIFELLKSILYSLTVILELKVIDNITVSIKLIEEILSYLTSIIVYIPKHSVICTKTLLKYLFGRNFQQRRQNYDFFLKKSFELCDDNSVIELFEYVKEFYTYKPSDLAVGDTNCDLGSYIKIFESMVIYCLKLFTKSNSEIQAEILDMLCQLLEFKVNYCLLDANNVFIDFVLRHIDVIEAGNVRKCELLIPNIMKFLFHLSKQKDKKLITIPKIINITDNLLANNMIRNGSIKSLVELAYETFFIQKIYSTGSQETEQLQIKDLNTQKEVVLSMLVKFLDNYEIRKITTVIITSIEPDNSIDENEIYQIFLSMIQDNKILINNLDILENVNNLFESFKKNVLFDSKNMELSIKLFLNTLDRDSIGMHEIGIVVILLKNLIFKTDEIYIENHIKYYLKEQQNNSTTPISSPNSYFINKFYKFLKLLIDKYEFDYGADNSTYLNFIKILFKNLKRIKNLKNLSKLLCDNFENDLKFVSRMFELNFASILIEFLIEINYDYKNLFLLLNDEKFMEILDKDVRLKLIRKLDENQDFLDNIDQPTIEYILQCNIDILFLDNSLFLLSLLTSPKHSNLVFDHIVNYYRKNPTNENLYSLLKLFEKSSSNIFLIIAKFLISTIVYKTKGITVKKSIILLLHRMMEINLENLSSNDLETFSAIISDIKSDKFTKLFNSLNFDEKYENLHNDLLRKTLDDKNRMIQINLDEIKTTNATDDWFYEQLKYYCCSKSNTISPKYIVDMLNEIKSESKLVALLDQPEFNLNILPDIIKITFDNMINNFKIDCIQYNPHINYLKVSILLKNSLNLLYNNLNSLVLNEPINFNNNQFLIKYNIIKQSIVNFLKQLTRLEETSLIFIEEKFIKKFIKDNLLKPNFYTLLLNYLKILLNNLKIILLRNNSVDKNVNEMKCILICVRLILNDNNLWFELNMNSAYTDIIFEAVNIIFMYLKNVLCATSFWRKYRCPDNFVEAYERHKFLKIYSKAMFIAKYIEEHDSIIVEATHFAEIQKITVSIATAILRTNILYSFAITPLELFSNYNFTTLNDGNSTAATVSPNIEETDFVTLPSIPIEYLNDVEILEKFVKRINTFGFSSRQQFEELFMTLLVLANKESDFDMIDPQEQLYIKNMCLYAIVELLISCKTYPRIGKKDDNFFHATRLNRISMDTISLKKLHKIQLLIPNSNIFYQPNLERTFSYTDEKFDNVIGTNKFLLNQIGMNFIWQLVEENAVVTNNSIKNSQYFIEELKIDIRSSLQLIYDVFSLCIDNENYVLVLPHLIKLSEICEKREQFNWIKDTMLLLQEKVPIEDTISHQYIIYLLCKSYAVLVPSLSDLAHLCTIIPKYLKSTHIFIRNATLCGLLSLLECCVNTNTTIGSLSEELLLLRNLVINYIIKYGIIDDSIISFSDTHTKLVWTLNFYLIEKTSKFVTDCNLLSNTIISANNILKNTINLEQYLCILYGLERIVITNTSNKVQREKIEKLVIDLIKLENEEYSVPALELLVTCMYIGSAEQIENTEYANGIVQDEPEVIVQSIEKIELLFMKIRSTKTDAANIFGNTLCQIVKDLVPPNEILTKVIKELLALNQPHCEIIAKIVFQVFRSTIDSSFHDLLQDWLICSLPNFVALPKQKSIWCLSIIFISASINLNIVKIFPEILGKSNTKFDDRIVQIFYISSKDFYDKLNKEQKQRFSNIFKECDYYIYKNMLKCL